MFDGHATPFNELEVNKRQNLAVLGVTGHDWEDNTVSGWIMTAWQDKWFMTAPTLAQATTAVSLLPTCLTRSLRIRSLHVYWWLCTALVNSNSHHRRSVGPRLSLTALWNISPQPQIWYALSVGPKPEYSWQEMVVVILVTLAESVGPVAHVYILGFHYEWWCKLIKLVGFSSKLSNVS